MAPAGAFHPSTNLGKRLILDFLDFRNPPPTTRGLDYVPTPPVPPCGSTNHYNMHGRIYQVVGGAAFRAACKKICKEIHGQLSLEDFNNLLRMVSKESTKRAMRDNRNTYRNRHNISHNGAVGWAANPPVLDGGDGAAANGTAAGSATINNAADGSNVTQVELGSDGSNYETNEKDEEEEELLADEDSILNEAIGGYMSDSSDADDCVMLSTAPHANTSSQKVAASNSLGNLGLDVDFGQLSMGGNWRKLESPWDVHVIRNAFHSTCLVVFELTPMGPLDRHKVEVSDDGWSLVYLCEIPKYKFDVAAMLKTLPDEQNIHQMRIATALKAKQARFFPKIIAVDGKMWRKVRSINLPFQVDQQLYNPSEEKVDWLTVQGNGLGHTVGLVLLKPRKKSPPPKQAPTIGTMEISECLRSLFQMHGSTTTAAGGAGRISADGFAVNSNVHQQPTGPMSAANGVAGRSNEGHEANSSGLFATMLSTLTNPMEKGSVSNSNNGLNPGSSLAATIPQLGQDSFVARGEQQPAQSNTPTNVADLERELAQVKQLLDEERRAALAKETTADRLKRDHDRVKSCYEELKRRLGTQSNQNTFHEQQLMDEKTRANQAELEIAKLRGDLSELQKKCQEEILEKEQANHQLTDEKTRANQAELEVSKLRNDLFESQKKCQEEILEKEQANHQLTGEKPVPTKLNQKLQS